jgi:hypothetical protein
MGTPVPFRTKKGEEFSPWKAVVNGKTIELAPASATQEEASVKLAPMIPQLPVMPTKKSVTLGDLFKNSGQTQQAEPSLSTDSIPSTTTEKTKPGELRKNGLSELGAVKLKAFREQIGFAVASGNVSIDRAIIGVFRDKVPMLAPEQHLLLSTGWELLIQEYFGDGVPPPWLIILLGNMMVCTALYEKSEPKKEEALPTNDGTIGNSTDRPKPNQ